MRYEDFKQIAGTSVSDAVLVEILVSCRLQSAMDVMKVVELLQKSRRKAYDTLEAVCRAVEEKRTFISALNELDPTLGRDLDATAAEAINAGLLTLKPAMSLAANYS